MNLFNLKKLSLILIINLFCIYNGVCQTKDSLRDGFYQTYNDYLSDKLKYEGDIAYIDHTSPSAKVVFEEKGRKEIKIKESLYWGCVNNGVSFRFYKGRAYQIVASGKITVLVKTLGSGALTIYLHKGSDNTPRKMTSQKIVEELLSDDTEVLEQFKKGESKLFYKILGNVIASVQLYNSRHPGGASQSAFF